MVTRNILPVLAALAVVLLAAGPEVAAQSASAVTSGTITAVTAATATTPAEVVVDGATFALTSATTYALAGPGLPSSPPAVTAAALAVGESAQVAAAATSTDGITDAQAIELDAQVTMGEITAVSSAVDAPTAFTVTTGSQSLAFTTAADAVVAPSAGDLALGQDVVVDSLAQGTGAATAYVVDAAGAFPAITGSVVSANGSSLVLSTNAGDLTFAYSSSVPVDVGSAATSDADLLPGTQATVTYGVSEAGATATAITLAATTVEGSITAATTSGDNIDLTLSTTAGSVTVIVPTTASVASPGPSGLVVGAAIDATGVLVGSTLTALSVGYTATAGTGEATGTITAVVPGTSISVDTASGTLTFALTDTTSVDVGSLGASVADLAEGEAVAVTYASGSATTTPTATAITVTAQTLSGTVGTSPTATAFTLTTAAGEVVDVSVAPDAVTTGTVVAGAAVTVSGVSLTSTTFEAFGLNVGSTSTAPTTMPEVVVGTIASVSSSAITLDTRDGQSDTVALTATTRVNLGMRTVTTSLLAAGEWARVRVAPDATVAGQEDAVAIYLLPRAVAGTVASVTTGASGTVVTLTGRMVGHLLPIGRGRGDGWGDNVHGGRTVTVTIPTGTPVTVLGQAGSTSATLAKGDAIIADGAIAGDGIVAVQVWLVPTPAARGPHQGHGRDGHRGDQGNQNNGHGHARPDKGHEGSRRQDRARGRSGR